MLINTTKNEVTLSLWQFILLNFINIPFIALACFFLVHELGCNTDTTTNLPAEDASSTKKIEDISFLDFDAKRGDAWIGIEARDVTQQEALAAGLDRVEGAYVTRIIPNSPAEEAEMASGDIVVSFNERKVRNSKQLQNDIAGAAIGEEAKMCVYRDDYRKTIEVTPVEKPPEYPVYNQVCPWMGLEVTIVTKESKEWLALEEAGKEGGVVVVGVFENGPAAEAGFLPKDVIASLNNRKVTSLRQFYTDLCGASVGETARVCIVRGEIRKTLYVTLGERPANLTDPRDMI